MSWIVRGDRRTVSRLLAIVGLVGSSPLIVLSALAIKVSSRGPVLYRARRVGRSGQPFTMLKLRSMHLRHDGHAASITAGRDERIFRVGSWLRRFKVDELPQLINVVRGEMTLVGPRPEDPVVVDHHYTRAMLRTLDVPPGLTSPGSLAYYAGEAALPVDPVRAHEMYVSELLPRKIALDLVYVLNRSWRYDVELLTRTVASIFGVRGLFLKRQLWEQSEAARLLRSGAIADAGEGVSS